MLSETETRKIQEHRDILSDAIARMGSEVNFSTIVTYQGREYEVTIVDYKR